MLSRLMSNVFKSTKANLDKKSAAGPVAQVQCVVVPVVKPQVAFETRAVTANEKKRHVFKEMRQLRSKAWRLAEKD